MGVWKVPGAAQTTTTAVAGMNPARGSGTGGTFTFTFTDTNGANDLGVMNILVNDWLDGRHACYLAYARGNNTLYLMNDNGDALLPGKVLNGSGSLGNSQCTVNGVGSSATPSGNTLTLTLNMSVRRGVRGQPGVLPGGAGCERAEQHGLAGDGELDGAVRSVTAAAGAHS